MTTGRSRRGAADLILGALSPWQAAWDIAIATACLAATLIVNLSGVESVAENRDHDLATVSLTVVVVGSLALRRRFPLPVLLVSLAAILGLVLIRGTVGLATIGPLLAFYTAVAVGSRRAARAAVIAVTAALLLTTVVRPVDLSQEGAVVNLIMFAGAYVVAAGARRRRERFTADVAAAEQRAELERQLAQFERERAQIERERSARTATEERLRITRELHDIIGHAMSVMVVQAGVAERLLDTEPDEARTAVAEIARTGRRSLAEMRQVLGVLRDGDPGGDGDESTPRGPAPRLEDIEALAARVRVAGLPVDVSVRGARPDVPPGVDLAAYRVVQEALTNCLRHSGASRATVTVTYSSAAVDIEVVDDGRSPVGVADGAPPEEVAPIAGHGIAGMRERVAIYGGELVARPLAGGGFRVHARLPLAVLAAATALTEAALS